ncbi:MAG: ABC transporter ATP-binding protein, partial [Planctomycetota bacterium]|nr:ABC transporter ATP-binding protein [Planctomycetota bacterium]
MNVEHRLELHAVTKRFGEFTAVAPLDMAVRHGEFIALLGPAGSGKSTTLRLIAGLEKPSSGTVHLDGFEVTPMSPQRRDVAFVFQSPALYPHMSVQRNIAFPMLAQRIPANAITRRVGEVIDRFQLDHLRRRKPPKLSPSDYQRVSLARAMVRDAKAFCFDEPLARFAGEHREHMRRELRAIHEELRATTMMATRDPLDAITTADRIVVMNEGRVVQFDTPQAIYDYPADLFVARYLGAQAMSFVSASHADGIARLSCCDLAIPVDDRGARPVDPARITLGIRPEHVRIDPRGVPATAVVTDSGSNGTVDLRLGDAPIRASIPPDRQVRDGEIVPIRFDSAGCRWFDATSGKALPWRTGTPLHNADNRRVRQGRQGRQG